MVTVPSLTTRVLEILCTKLDAKDVSGAPEVHSFLGGREARGFSVLMDEIVAKEQDEAKIWDLCGFCLLGAVEALKEVLPVLERAIKIGTSEPGVHSRQ